MDNSLSSGSSFNRLAHAQSTPAGVDGSGTSTSKTPPATPKKAGKMIGVRVQMLDDSITVFQVQAKAIGRLLFDQVCKQLNLLEADYFGLEYQDATTKYWLDFEKPLHRQVGLSLVDPLLRFCVKFYTPDPAQLEEEYTRYLFCLQIKRDLLQGDLQCNDNTAALIISYIVQAECGDYTSEDYPDSSYLAYHKFVPHQDRELERKIMENHKKHVGQSPAEADLNLLETARRCELYGMIMHPAKDQESVPLNLAVAHMGIVVFQNCTKINTFSWAKIRKISFKRKRFLIKLHPEGYGYYKDVVEFIFDNRNQCKSFWKKCVENHGFFRCSYVKRIPRQKARVLSRGSSFRYSGKTQKQMVEYVRENYVKRQTFQRSQSFRHQSSTHSSVVNVGASISAHPLLPLGENAIAGSGASLSCGSMTLSGSLSPTIPPEGGPQTAPTATTPATQQAPADVHEPATTSSDITSIASQSPPHDTGQKPHYQSTFTANRFTEKLTNTARLPTNDKDKFKGNVVVEPAPPDGDSGGKDAAYEYDFDTENMYTEFRFPMTAPKTTGGRVEKDERGSNFDHPDILKDLGKPGRDDFGWQRSASCKELGMLYRQERLLKADATEEAQKDDTHRKFDSYRYCYSCHGQTPSFDKNNRDQHSTEMKVYSSSYPGTTPHTSVESDDEPVAGAAFVMDKEGKEDYQKISQDDLSHDSYEILEKEAAFRSRSSSVESDEMFVMESDYKSISKHILWREGSADVEKRLGYVEPRYRNIGFNEFNEICKRGFAARNRDTSQSHGNIKFSEFGTKPCFETKSTQIGHDSVARTKSDPYMLSKQKSSNKQKLYGLHQKSFELPPTEFNDVIEDDRFSKSTVDIPYTLRIRNAMNGTARDADSNCYDDSCIYENITTLRSKSEEAGLSGDPKNKSHASDHASQDSGLSLSLGMESVDDNDIDLKNIMLTKNNYEQVVTTKKSTKLMLSLSEENNENVSIEEPSARPDDTKKSDGEADKKEKESKCKSKSLLTADNAITGEKHITKVKSMEVPKKTHSCKMRKSRSAETYDRKSSFLRTDSTGSRGKKEIIVIDSDDYHSFDDSRSDKRSDGSDSVIIVEYRGNRRKKLSKKASSDSRGSQAESEASSFDAPRIKKKDLKKRNSAQGYFSKDRIPTIEISEDETYKADGNSLNTLRPRYQYEYSSDERQASGSDLSKTEVINEMAEDNVTKEQHFESTMTEDEMEKEDLVADKTVEAGDGGIKNDEIDTPKALAECEEIKPQVPQRISSSPKREEKSPILTRLGLSEGSAISQMTQHTLSPSAARRAKSLDTPIVSLHRLPPITSFSSKDDTVDSEEGVVLEEKTLKQMKSKLQSVNETTTEESTKTETTDFECIRGKEENTEKENQEESKTESISEEVSTVIEKTIVNQNNIPLSKELKRNSIAVASMWKKSLDIRSPKHMENVETTGLNKERSKSEGYEKNLTKECLTPDRKHSTRQERLDSFKKLKNFSIELWESDDVEIAKKKFSTSTSKEYDDNVFDEDLKSPKSPKPPQSLDERIEKPPVPERNAQVSTKPSVPEKNAQVLTKPSVPEKNVQVSTEPSVPEKNVKVSTKPSVPEKNVQVSTKPTVPEKTVQVLTKPSVPEKNVQVSTKPSVPERNVQVSTKPPVPEKNVQVSTKPLPPERNAQDSTKLIAEKIVANLTKPPIRDKTAQISTKSPIAEKNTQVSDKPAVPERDFETSTKSAEYEKHSHTRAKPPIPEKNIQTATKPSICEKLPETSSKPPIAEKPSPSTIAEKKSPLCSTDAGISKENESNTNTDFDTFPEPPSDLETDQLVPESVTPNESSDRKCLKLDFRGAFTPEQIQEMEIIQGLLNASPTTAEAKDIPEKRSFDDEPSSSSSIKPELLKPYPLESSGSSSVEEAMLPPDYMDDEELPDVTNVNINFDSPLGKSTSGMSSTSFGTGFFSLSRTLSRISERSTTSEQERTDLDDDSTKPLSRSLSIDDSIISSDQHPSFSSDPPSGMNLENVFDEDDGMTVDLDDDKLDFNIPPPLLSGDGDWPSPPHSTESAKTPVIDNELYSAPLPLSPKKGSDEGSVSEDKTLQDEEVSDHEDKIAFLKEKSKPRGSIGDDTSAGITTSDWSSSTGTTIKQAHSHGPSYGSKSEDNSLAGDYGVSLSTEMASESRKSSTDDLAPIPLEKKYLTLDRKQTSFERKQIFFPPSFHSFEDEYDSPYTESEDTPSSPIPSHMLRKPPPPPRHFQTDDTNPNNGQKPRTKVERNRAAKFLPHYTSSSMSTSLESPTSAERKFAKSVAKAKCYSYYSLARSPPSDGSSSSPDAPETPLTPNTIPRVSKRRRNPHTMRRRQQRPNETHGKPNDYSTSPSSAHTPHTPKQFHYPPRRTRH